MITRKALMVTRHGIAEPRAGESREDPSLTDKSISNMYLQAQNTLREALLGTTYEGVFLVHSGKKRTIGTALTRATGVLGYQPAPSRIEDLDQLPDILRANMSVEPMLGFGDLVMDEVAYGKDGHDTYMANWTRDPNSGLYGATPVTPFNNVVRTRTKPLFDSLNQLARPDSNLRLGVLASHGGIVEATMVAGVNSGSRRQVTNLGEVGGIVSKEGFGTFHVDVRPSGKIEVNFVRDGRAHPVDMYSLFVAAGYGL